jgi:threonine dehydratase
VYPIVRPTQLLRHPLLAAETGLDIHVKHENHNPTCSFKVRGGLNLVGSLPAADRRGVISASTGNHGQSIAFAARREGVPCTIVTPHGNNPDKNASMRAMGAEVIEFGKDFDEARERVEQMCLERGLRYIHSANEPLLIAGVATYALEIFEEMPDATCCSCPSEAAVVRRAARSSGRRSAVGRRSSGCRPRALMPLPVPGRRDRGWSGSRPTPLPRAWRPASPSI